MVDQTIVYPKKSIEDILIMVTKFIIPIYFIVLEYKAGDRVSIILRHPFMATKVALIDVKEGTFTMWLDNEEIVFKV